MTWRIITGDCVERMRELDAASIDAVVTDPPYHLAFMGKTWDTVTPGESQHEHERWAREALRVLKPGGHLLAFGGTRTYHRLAAGIEDAGFDIRDTIAWMYGSGFPKSLDVSKQIDKTAGAEREIVGEYVMPADSTAPGYRPSQGMGYGSSAEEGVGRPLTAPATPEAQAWEGWGTALKPAHEPIVVARKPLDGTVASTVLRHGTGALNIDGCRIGMSAEDAAFIEKTARPNTRGEQHNGTVMNRPGAPTVNVHDAGRWPANCVLDERAAELLDEQTGDSVSRSGGTRTRANDAVLSQRASSMFRADADHARGGFDDSGGASRFMKVVQHTPEPEDLRRALYMAKASSAERNAGLDDFPEGPSYMVENGSKTAGLANGQRYDRTTTTRNPHPTVKPINLMRWLIRLVTPPGGLVLDPFTGSGTTGCAAMLERVRFVGIERDEEYLPIARARIEWWARHPDGVELTRRLEAEQERRERADTGQLDIFGGMEAA